MFINQAKNQVSGDLIGGNKSETTINITGSQSPDELTLLYAKLKSNGSGDLSDGTFCEQLEHYLSAVTDGDVRGLAAKLEESGREDLLNFAMGLKERAAKSLMRYQTSRTAQRVYTIILDELHTSFMLSVTPVIQAGASRDEVDQRINLVLQQTKAMLGENILEFTVKDLLSLLYFLGGNCHIRWDKC
ncbi:ABC-three component system protein [Pseudomonas frederiksbergensis]|uniref:ABC-three component systems C-terminal domain-containing protein n=1 Tax=Pseudomonas frederiksbergensis TaxID=104087 RepID=A0A423KNM1_9PSED|nr:ABC-three component system protein [Pseudomonas frederiksbergensis]RON55937.1 hypothetical protein BK665_08205 [Pseudomonas frederiksbergensis]